MQHRRDLPPSAVSTTFGRPCPQVPLWSSSLGFRTSGNSTLACGPPLIGVVTPDTTGITDVVDSLMVRGTLVASNQVNGTLTVTGGGARDPTNTAALLVTAGAAFEGRTSHHSLTVAHESCMNGPLAVSNVYGPVVVSANPSLAVPPVGGVLQVLGGEQVDALEVTAQLTAADTAIVGSFTVNGLYAGPEAAATLENSVLNGLVTITATVGGVPTNISGFAVAPNLVMTHAYISVAGAGVAINDPAVTALPITATVARAGAAPAIVTLNVVAVNLPLLTAVLEVVPTHGFQFTTVLPLATHAAEEDFVAAGSSVLVGFQDAGTASRSAATGVVVNASINAVAEATSVHVGVPGVAVPDGALGAPIINFAGKVVGMLHYGTPNMAASAILGGSALYAVTAGGFKGRYLNYVLQTSLSTLPVLEYAPTQTGVRGITPTDRYVALAGTPLTAGGMTYALGAPATPADQILSLSLSDGKTVLIGVDTQNSPSATDVVLAAFMDGLTVDNVKFASVSGGSVTDSSVTSSVTPLGSLWNSGTPCTVAAGTIPAHGATTSYEINRSTDGLFMTGISAVTPMWMKRGPCSGGVVSTLAATDMAFLSITDNTAATTSAQYAAWVLWGSKAALDAYLAPFGSWVTPAWAAFLASVPGGLAALPASVIVSGGFVLADNTWKFSWYAVFTGTVGTPTTLSATSTSTTLSLALTAGALPSGAAPASTVQTYQAPQTGLNTLNYFTTSANLPLSGLNGVVEQSSSLTYAQGTVNPTPTPGTIATNPTAVF